MVERRAPVTERAAGARDHRGSAASDPGGSAFDLHAGARRQPRGRGDLPVTLTWGPGAGAGAEPERGKEFGYSVIAPGATRADVWITEEGLALENELLRSFLLNVCIFLVRRAGLHHVHGATLADPSGRGWMLVGESGSGKSTTTILLARHGWSVGTDDISFLVAGDEPGTTDMVAWREPLALRADSAAAMAEAGMPGTRLPRGKMGWFIEELGTPFVSRISPTIIGFTRLGTTGTTTVTPVSAREALTRLMHGSPWVMLEADYANEHLDLMSRLVRQSRSFEIALGRDLLDRPGILMDLISEHTA